MKRERGLKAKTKSNEHRAVWIDIWRIDSTKRSLSLQRWRLLSVKRVTGANARFAGSRFRGDDVRSISHRVVNRALTLVTRISPLSYGISARACRSGKRRHQADSRALKTDQIDFRGMSLMCRDHDVTDEFEFPHELEILFETRKWVVSVVFAPIPLKITDTATIDANSVYSFQINNRNLCNQWFYLPLYLYSE